MTGKNMLPPLPPREQKISEKLAITGPDITEIFMIGVNLRTNDIYRSDLLVGYFINREWEIGSDIFTSKRSTNA